MEITLDNGRPGVLCCYQEDYHRRLDRPEGTWKRVIVTYTTNTNPTAIANHQLQGTEGNIEEPQRGAASEASWKSSNSD